MMINGYYNDGEVNMLYSIVVMVMMGEQVLELGPVFRGIPVFTLPKDLFMERSPRTYGTASSYMALAWHSIRTSTSRV